MSGTAQAGLVAEGRRVPRSQSGARAVSADAPIVMLWALIALGAALRFALIGHQGYWLDEGITIEQLHRSFGGTLHALRFRESTPPLYYMLAWGWARVFGFGEAPLRSLSAVVGLAMVPTAYLAGKELVSRRLGLIAVEPEPYLRGQAEQAATRAPIPVQVVAGGAGALGLADGSVDAVVFCGVLCSVPV